MSVGQPISSGSTFVHDFDPMCACGKPATHLLRVHATDYCTPDKPEREDFHCTECVGKAYKLAAKLLHPSGTNFCATCYLTFDNLSDIIVSLIPIPPREGDDQT